MFAATLSDRYRSAETVADLGTTHMRSPERESRRGTGPTSDGVTGLAGVTTATAGAVVTPPGFTDSVAIGGLSTPTVAAFAPDGRVFIGRRAG
jgi:hypothetical protein